MKGAVKGAVRAALPTKQTRLFGLPIGPRRTDWVRVGRLAAMGVGAASTAAAGVGARLARGKAEDETAAGEQGAEETTETGAEETMEQPDGVAEEAPAGEAGAGEARAGAGEMGARADKAGGAKNVKELRHIVREAIDVGVPLKTAYNQWTQFTELPSIMRGPQKVDQEADDETRWIAKVGPFRRRWTAKIVEQNPDERIAWDSTDGTENRGAITFHRLDRNLTRVQVEMEYFPHGAVETVGNLLRAPRRRVRKDLRLFKHFLEVAGAETGGWRGEISIGEQGQTEVRQPEQQGASEDEDHQEGDVEQETERETK